MKPAGRARRRASIGRPAIVCALVLITSTAAFGVVDVSLGEFHSLGVLARVAPWNGCSVVTTACNVGTERVDWRQQMNPLHPKIAFSLYRLENNRLEQIGISWAKHAYFALDDSHCSTCSDPNGGSGLFLGVNCSDTYSLDNNGIRFVLGPRSELDPWTTAWTPLGSYFDNAWGAAGDGQQFGVGPTLGDVDHRMIVHDNDLDPTLHPSAVFYTEGVYLVLDDANRANNIGRRRIGVSGSPGSFTFANQNPDGTPMTNSHVGRTPQYGPALDVWGSDRVSLNAGQSTIAADGVVHVAMQATDLGGGTWHYEYAIYNYNFDKQVNSFSVPVPSCASVTNQTFRDAPYSVALAAAPWAQDLNGADWSFSTADDAATWNDTAADNPIRWGQLFNFAFDCDRAPAASVITLTTARLSTPSSLAGALSGPAMSYRKGDVNGDAIISAADVSPFVDVLLVGTSNASIQCAADMNNSGALDGEDIQLFTAALY